MNKTMKIVSIILMAIIIMSTLSTVVMASDVDKTLGYMNTGASKTNTEEVGQFGGKIMSLVSTAGIVIAVIVLLILGIKYMIGSASEKAEYKKTMIPYLLGATLLLGASLIIPIISSIVSGLFAK